MSYGDSGQAGGYVPPPPAAARGRSPWLYVGLGCGLLTLLTFGGCALFIANIGNSAKQAMKQPFDAPKAEAALKATGVPVYPGAKLNAETSKMMQGILSATSSSFKFIPGMSAVTMSAIVYDPPAAAEAETVAKWYDTKMLASGWKTSTARNQFGGNTPNVQAQRQYVKGDTQVMVQISEGKGSKNAGQRMLNLMTFKGMPAEK